MRILVALLLSTGPAWAVRVYVPLPTLCAQAPVVAIGEVTAIEGRWRAGEPGGIESVVDVAITRVVRGSAPDAVTVVLPGGTVGRVTETISEAPRARVDARYLMLLAPGADGYTLVGGADGLVPVPWTEGAEAAAIARLGGCHE